MYNHFQISNCIAGMKVLSYSDIKLTKQMFMMTHPLKTCCCPLASPVRVVSFRIVCTPLSTVTWAIPAPIRPAPKMARVLLVGNKRHNLLIYHLKKY